MITLEWPEVPVRASDYLVPVLVPDLLLEPEAASGLCFESSVAVSYLFEQSTDCAL